MLATKIAAALFWAASKVGSAMDMAVSYIVSPRRRSSRLISQTFLSAAFND
jgi:hypothetical protein